jgi:opacity protein-like surface antigen
MMKRFLALAALALLLAAPAHAQGPKGGLGFHTANSPFLHLPLTSLDSEASPTVGGRHWFNSNVGVDAGIGYSQLKVDPNTSTWTGFTFDLGVPISVKKVNDKVNLILRPGFQWGSLEDESGTPTVKWTGMMFSGEFEVEWMVVDNLSVSAAHGFGYSRIEDDGSPKTEITSFRTTGSSFTNLGFHVYLW